MYTIEAKLKFPFDSMVVDVFPEYEDMAVVLLGAETGYEEEARNLCDDCRVDPNMCDGVMPDGVATVELYGKDQRRIFQVLALCLVCCYGE